MSYFGRNDADGLLGRAAEEQRRRADEEAASAARRVVAERFDVGRMTRERRPRWTTAILSRISHILGR